MPEIPFFKANKFLSMPDPRGETQPKPVITTRRIFKTPDKKSV
jgi:hypothetical protein